MSRFVYILMVVAVTLFSCSQNKGPAFRTDDPEQVHQRVKRLTEVIIYDVFTPPVAARIYAYTSLAQYEAMRFAQPGNPSIAATYNGFGQLPEPEKGKEYDFYLAALKAFTTVAYNVRIFAVDSLKMYEESELEQFRNALSEEVFDRSVSFGTAIGDQIIKRAATDQYKEIRSMPKYIGSNIDGKWRPTSPDYQDAVEPYWMKIHPFSMDSASQFLPSPPPPFSKDTTSPFYKMVDEVYSVAKNITPEQKEIARYWDDNPFVVEHSGHMMFANKKITPGGHWMGITAIACRKSGADAIKSARAYAMVAPALLDAFISCWDTKYRYEYVRPITLINEWKEQHWDSFLQTPPFPEYTSGHSTISGAAAAVLTGLFGDNFSFLDDSDKEYIGMTREFKSFNDAAAEASVSRLLGGIHYRASLDTGLAMGYKIGAQLLGKVSATTPAATP